MKFITIYEMFAGLGSQYLALKNLESKFNFKAVSLGSCDFYIDAIISYMIIHYGTLKLEDEISNEKQIEILSKYKFSNDSKKLVSSNYFKKLNPTKLSKIFPYLYAYLNNDYFHKMYGERERERERERES